MQHLGSYFTAFVWSILLGPYGVQRIPMCAAFQCNGGEDCFLYISHHMVFAISLDRYLDVYVFCVRQECIVGVASDSFGCCHDS